ncbi:MAG TPA: FliA/WhiG family RNA polymerase sigma factor [Candidatus Polarisedimenticolia bacterium]|nr:FliA/WhiG family RNA polymerase sigma factor [Candidatus Polarisedimenticolia bacterium]
MKGFPSPLPWSEEVRAGDPERRQHFLESHVGLVRYLALRLATRLPASVEVGDLVHDGIVGLLDAVEKFDPARGVGFRTYAAARVRGAILDGLRKRDWRPRAVRRGQRELEETLGRLAAEQGRPATEEEIARALGLDLHAYRAWLQDLNGGPLLSLEDLPPGEDPAETADSLLPSRGLERHEMVEALAQAVHALPERERRVMELYYYEELNMKEVGEVLGVTESRVCQLHAQAAARLRVMLQARLHPLSGEPGEVAAESVAARERR